MSFTITNIVSRRYIIYPLTKCKRRYSCTYNIKRYMNEEGERKISLHTAPIFDVEEVMNKEKLLYVIKNIQIVDLKEKNILNNISNLLKKYINEYTIEEIYTIIHIFCKLKFTKYSLYNNFIKIIMNKKPKIDSRMLTQILIDLHKLSSLDINVLTFFTQYYIKKETDQFSLFDLSMILYIFNKYNYNHIETVDNISKTISQYFLPYIDQDKGVLTTILLSISTLNLNYQFYLDVMKKHVYKKYEHFEVKYLCNILYSILLRLVNTLHKDDILNIMLNDIMYILLNNINKLKNEELKQLHISLYYLKDMKEEKYEEARKIIEKKNIKDTVTTSKIQQQIAKLFKEIGLNVEKEFLIGPYVLDFALKKKKICIEVNGFTHYYNFNGKINAKTTLKYYILNKLKWKVLTIEYMDWKNKSKEDKIKYLETNVLEKIM
ncbi:RAP protein [Plasmodium falciparum NF54]|uniref:RAP protein, putative n=4 Tax=Plasmodium falciparum TaxID=5833 RepID=Q8IJF8_PLAF7|nr:RAP protein, putative [Plasmodium falciparum 3D7]KAF4328039.1 RAP protein [Plasmodium falciparum NF54]PKC43589.1 RAP protein [Plasmodium falciparum NF54]CZT98501.1 RAP protein, putative [Plasmodium falciparum 3D7]|eukprot:XP_001347524.2 RAP protein, putative [Plasmodium falciparum 3D7]